METATPAGVQLVAKCATCNKIRYRGAFPFSKPEDARAENFIPVDGAPEVTGDGPPLCHECQSMLKFEAEQTEKTGVPRRLQAVRQGSTEKPAAPAVSIRTVFETVEGEAILDVRGAFIITNKRIVELTNG